MTVKVTSSAGLTRFWCLPRALLSFHSGYFRRVKNFKEGIENVVELTDHEPSIFELFVKFMYYKTYTGTDNLRDHTRVPDSAKVWVLGDYLDAPRLKKFAIDSLIDMYLPKRGDGPIKSSFGPEAIRYCCENSISGSALYELYVGAAATYWRHRNVVQYNDANQRAWNAVWEGFPDFRNELFRLMTLLPKDTVENTIHRLGRRVADMEKAGK